MNDSYVQQLSNLPLRYGTAANQCLGGPGGVPFGVGGEGGGRFDDAMEQTRRCAAQKSANELCDSLLKTIGKITETKVAAGSWMHI